MNTWQIDQAHSEITFKVKHLIISTVRGHFKKFEGTVTTTADDFSDASVNLSIDASSIDTNNEGRDGHLKSPDFFDVATFPTITFSSTSLVKTAQNHFDLTGTITMHGVTKEITFHVIMNGMTQGISGERVASFEAHTTLIREDFGLEWNKALEMGGVAVGSEIKIEIIIELKEAV